ncbi:hypothetical protein VTH06DRAFT_3173 [Thermothelomyces fergusii]
MRVRNFTSYFNSLLVLVIHGLKTHLPENGRDNCLASTALLVVEIVNLLAKATIPAVLYTLQNSLVYEAVSNLNPVTFLATYQLKIFTTVLCIQSRRRLRPEIGSSDLPLSFGADPSPRLTGVYFEGLVKNSVASVSLWIRNVQLSLFSLFPTLCVSVLWQDSATIRADRFFAGYNSLMGLAIGLQAFGGLIVAVCIAYADNMTKISTASLSIVVSYAATALIFGTPMTPHVRLSALWR